MKVKVWFFICKCGYRHISSTGGIHYGAAVNYFRAVHDEKPDHRWKSQQIDVLVPMDLYSWNLTAVREDIDELISG